MKASENPPMLAPWADAVGVLQGRWWVAQTKARAEKAAAWDLLNRGVGYFLPLIERVTLSGGRKRRVMMPLFPSYIFVCGHEEDRYTAMTTNRFSNVLPVADQDSLRRELVSLSKALAGKAVLDPYPFAAKGARCRVTAGPFQGLEGVVIRRRRIARLVLHVDVLGRGAAMEIDAALLESAA